MKNLHHRRLFAQILSLAATLTFAGCGSDADTKPTAAADTTQASDAAADTATTSDAATDAAGAADAGVQPCPANTCAIALAGGVTCAVAGAGPDACRRCEPAKSTSSWTSQPKAPCDDGDACTTGDACDLKDVCAGTKMSCDDGKPCTADSCKAGVCGHDFTSAGCDDGDPCTGDGTCVTGVCKSGLPKFCTDNDPCTADTCVVSTGACTSALDPNACDDANSCTTDSCDSKKGCDHVTLTKGATCSDTDACTHGETCTATGSCASGTPSQCDDANPCTTDSCDKQLGCVNQFNSASCTDGEACTTGDACSGGICLGQKTATCAACKKTFGATSAQLTQFEIGADGEATNGLDVDGDPKTCAPAGKCSGGVDNAFASLAFVLNPALASAVKSGALRFVADFDGFTGPNVFFKLHLYYAVLSPSSVAKSCQPQSQPCGWLVSQQAFTAKCEPRVTFNDAKLVGTTLTAGGPGTVFAMEVSLAGGDATFLVKGARLEGTLTLAADGKTVTKFSGVIGGSMTEKAILSTFAGLPDDAFKPLTKAGAMALVKTLLVLDVDADGDGKPESTSVGLKIDALGATLEGLSPQ